MNDFSSANRNSGWWSTDCRRAVNGELIEVILEKQGKRVRPPIDSLPPRQQEAMRMGLIMQPTIARLFEDAHGIRLKEMDVELTHPTEPWCKSHFDFITEDGSALVECKNYNIAAQFKYSDEGEPVRVAPADYAQCLHEACVANVSTVYLAVLFGGSAFRSFRLDFTAEEKAAHLSHFAAMWAHVVQGTLPEPQSGHDARLAYDRDDGSALTASLALEQLIAKLKSIRAQRKSAEYDESVLEEQLLIAMGNASEVRAVSGETLVTWKATKPTKRFDADLFKSQNPAMYASFVVERPGSRRLLIK